MTAVVGDPPAKGVLKRMRPTRTPVDELDALPLSVDDVLAYTKEFCGDDALAACRIYPAFGPETVHFADGTIRSGESMVAESVTGDNIMNFWIETADAYWYFGYEPEDFDARALRLQWYLSPPIAMDSSDVDAVEQTLGEQNYPVCSPTERAESVRQSVRA
jgi:hypothetical protein